MINEKRKINQTMFDEFEKLLNTDIDSQIHKNNKSLAKLIIDDAKNKSLKYRSSIGHFDVDSILKTFYIKLNNLQLKQDKSY